MIDLYQGIAQDPPPSSLLIVASHFQEMLSVTLQLGFNCNAENYKLYTVNWAVIQ